MGKKSMAFLSFMPGDVAEVDRFFTDVDGRLYVEAWVESEDVGGWHVTLDAEDFRVMQA